MVGRRENIGPQASIDAKPARYNFKLVLRDVNFTPMNTIDMLAVYGIS